VCGHQQFNLHAFVVDVETRLKAFPFASQALVVIYNINPCLVNFSDPTLATPNQDLWSGYCESAQASNNGLPFWSTKSSKFTPLRIDRQTIVKIYTGAISKV
jgi:hypothetical protein